MNTHCLLALAHIYNVQTNHLSCYEKSYFKLIIRSSLWTLMGHIKQPIHLHIWQAIGYYGMNTASPRPNACCEWKVICFCGGQCGDGQCAGDKWSSAKEKRNDREPPLPTVTIIFVVYSVFPCRCWCCFLPAVNAPYEIFILNEKTCVYASMLRLLHYNIQLRYTLHIYLIHLMDVCQRLQLNIHSFCRK